MTLLEQSAAATRRACAIAWARLSDEPVVIPVRWSEAMLTTPRKEPRP